MKVTAYTIIFIAYLLLILSAVLLLFMGNAPLAVWICILASFCSLSFVLLTHCKNKKNNK